MASRMLKSGNSHAFHHDGLHLKEHVWGQVPKGQGIVMGKCVVIFTHSVVDSGQII